MGHETNDVITGPGLSPPWGELKPRGLADGLLSAARAMPAWEPTYRVALALADPIIALLPGVVDTEVDGIKFRLHLTDNVCERRVFVTPKRFDPAERAFLAGALSPGGRFVDLGANAGLYSMFMAKVVGPGGLILAVEPQEAVHERLLTNRELNGFDQIRTMRVAVSDHEGEMTLYENPGNRGEASLALKKDPSVSGRKVPVRPLLALLNEAGFDRVDALKIDIEGHEDSALGPFLAEAPETLLPRRIVAENSRKHWARDWPREAESRGYRVVTEDRRNILIERV